VEIIGKREVVFSNGERKAYESSAKWLLMGICLGLSLPVFALICWALARSGNQAIPWARSGGNQGQAGGTTTEQRTAADRPRE
jgi:hypothetical protein